MPCHETAKSVLNPCPARTPHPGPGPIRRQSSSAAGGSPIVAPVSRRLHRYYCYNCQGHLLLVHITPDG